MIIPHLPEKPLPKPPLSAMLSVKFLARREDFPIRKCHLSSFVLFAAIFDLSFVFISVHLWLIYGVWLRLRRAKSIRVHPVYPRQNSVNQSPHPLSSLPPAKPSHNSPMAT